MKYPPLNRLVQIADDLEDLNFHSECAFIRAYIKAVEAGKIEYSESNVTFLASYNWCEGL